MVVLVTLLAIAGGLWYGKTQKAKPQEPSPYSFTEIKKRDEIFTKAVENIISGDFEGGRALLEQNLGNISEPELQGIYKLWIAVSYRNSNVKQFAKELIAVATNEAYAPRTRTFAYAFLGEVYAGLPPKDVLDTIANNPSFLSERVVSASGQVDYRQTMINILEKSSLLQPNPLIFVREASIRLATSSLTTEDVEAIKSGLSKATLVQEQLQFEDTLPLYPSYTYLRARVVGGLALYAQRNPSQKIEVLENADDMFKKAIEVTSSSGETYSEASARLTYVKYLIESYPYQNSSPPKTKSSLIAEIEEIVAPFKTKEALTKSVHFQLLLNAKKSGNPSYYAVVKEYAKYSPTLSEIFKKNGAL